jgi:hypothetical protein
MVVKRRSVPTRSTTKDRQRYSRRVNGSAHIGLFFVDAHILSIDCRLSILKVQNNTIKLSRDKQQMHR